jgi:hypothetical protein
LAVLLIAVVGLGISVVDRNTVMRELRMDYERLQAVRDSLTIANLRARLDLVAVVRPDKVYRALTSRGFSIPSSSRLRFVLYPESVPEGTGGLTARLRDLVVSEARHKLTLKSLRQRQGTSPPRFSLPDSGEYRAG